MGLPLYALITIIFLPWPPVEGKERVEVCRGGGSVSGLYTKAHLPPGVNIITTVPPASCNLNISLLRPHNNHLVIKLTDGSFIINDPDQPSDSGEYEIGDTVLSYTRGDGNLLGETITSDGPIDQPIQLALLVSDINYGVEYKFLAPLEKKSRHGARRGRARGKERYRWTMKILGPCSSSCGGGSQTVVAECVRGGRVVPDSRCSGDRPGVRTVRCGTRPCPAGWQPGEWGPCSVSCGQGLQRRSINCRQQLSQSVSIPVSASLCEALPPPVEMTERKCEVSCQETEVVESDVMATQPQPLKTDWVIQPWGPCSVSCGGGVRERRIHCAAQDQRGGLVPDSQCRDLTRPAEEEYCQAGPCVTDVWLVGDWGQCSATCGHGKVHRKVTCLGHCEEASKPRAEEDCQAGEECGQEWLTGRWTVCSQHCGAGLQTRSVQCLLTAGDGTKRLGRDEDCGDKRRPKEVRRCHIQRCGPEWFTTEWSNCSDQCGREGVRSREIVCLHNYTPSNLCRGKPDTTETCIMTSCDPKREEEEKNYEDQVEEDEEYNEIDDLADIEKNTKTLVASEYNKIESEISNEIVPEKHFKFREKDEVCRDKFKNCNVVVQSRLCRYSFYQSNCCRSCAKLKNS